MRKKTGISVIGICAVAALLGGAMSLSVNRSYAQETVVFEKADGITYRYNVSDENEISGKKGLLLSTGKSAVTVETKNTYVGKFVLEFRPTSETCGVEFTVTDVDGRSQPIRTILKQSQSESETLSFFWGDTELGRAKMTFEMGDDPIQIGFDPATLQIYTAYAGATELQSFGVSQHLTTHNELETMGEYTVKMTISGGTAEAPAELIAYSLNGQSFAGKQIPNMRGAEIISAHFHSAAKGKNYVIDTDSIVVCDALDGALDFDGVISVTDPLGEPVPVQNGTFFTETAGNYTVSLRAYDQDGILGAEKRFTVCAEEIYKLPDLRVSLPMEDKTVGKGSTVDIYSATAYSEKFGGKLPVDVSVQKGNETVAAYKDIKEKKELVLPQAGEYSIVYQTTDGLGERHTFSTKITVAEQPYLTREPLNEVYSLGEDLIVPNGESEDGVSCSTSVRFPTGETVTAQKVKLNVLGVYRLDYTLTKNGTTYIYSYYFEVKARADALFETTKDMSVTAGAESPAYMDIAIGGALLSARLPNAQAIYKNVIDLSDSTKNDLLTELYVTPQEKGTREIREFEIRLTDIHDEENYVTIGFKPNPWLVYQGNYIAVYAYHCGISNKNETYLNSSFFGKYHAFSDGVYNYTAPFSSTIRLYWDNAEKALYADLKGARTLVVDLDDPETVGVDAFKGFTTGEVRFSIAFTNLDATAHVLVSSVAGQSLQTEYVEASAGADIVIATETEQIPCACVGKSYPLFDSYANDIIDGRLYVQKTVYFLLENGGRKRVPVNDDSFIPNEKGTYEIVYATVNSAGFRSSRSVFVEALLESEIDPLALQLKGEYEQEFTQGEIFSVLAGDVTGGSGSYRVKIVLKNAGETVYENAAFAGKIELATCGDYAVDYVVTDEFTGMTLKETYSFVVQRRETPVFTPLNMPKGVICGATYNLPKATAYDFSSGEKLEATVVTKVNGQALTSENERTVCFDREQQVVVEYVATGAQGKTSTMQFVLQAIDVKNTEKPLFLSRYFLYEDSVTVKTVDEKMMFETDGSQTVSFINKIPVAIFSVKFAIPAEYATADVFTVILTDSLNPLQKVELALRKDSSLQGESAFTINGVKQNPIAGEFGGSGIYGDIVLTVENGVLKDAQNNEFRLVDEAGGVFEGFSSGYVYMDIVTGTPNAGEKSGFTMVSVINQPFGTATTDRIKPVLYSGVEIPLRQTLGEKVVLNAIRVYDVLDPNPTLTVSVDVAGKNVLQEQEYQDGLSFTLSEFGYYNIMFVAQDSAKRVMETYMTVKVYDETLSTLSLTGKYETTAKVGKTVKIASASTNGALTVFVIHPSGKIEIVESSFVPTRAGVYRVMYYATNAYGLGALKTYEITVY